MGPRYGKGVVPVRLDAYPKSSGLVLRVMGKEVNECAANVAAIAIEPIIAAKHERYGPHASHLPGWEPHWKRQQKRPRV